MGYSKSPFTVNKHRPHIAGLAEGKAVRWGAPFPDNVDAWGWAYKVRECLHIIKRYPAKFPDFHRFASRYTVEVLDDTTVQATLAESPVMEQAVTIGHETPIHGLQTASTLALTIPGCRSAMEIINHWLKVQPSSEKLHYPEAQLSDDELRKLVRWAANIQPPWMVLQAKGTNSITLMKEDPTVPAGARVTFNDPAPVIPVVPTESEVPPRPFESMEAGPYTGETRGRIKG